MIGRTVSHYRIEGLLGRGGMGIVYRARDERLQVTRALKFVHAEAVGDPTVRTRLLREARRAARLSHPAIVRIIEVDEFEGRPFLAMEYVEGSSLHQCLEEGPLTVGDAVLMAIQVAEGLAAAHAEGIVHRDLKPGNIVCGRDGQARIVDFGLARARDDSLLTEPGALVGTIPYMAPEQLAGGEVDHRCDLWALGAILFETITGRPPFAASSRQALVEAILRRPSPSLERLCPGAPPALARIVERALAKDPRQRYGSAGELLGDLRGVQRGLREAAGVTTVDAPGRRIGRRPAGLRALPRAWLLALAATAAGVAGLTWLIRTRPPGSEQSIRLPGQQRRLTWDPGWEGDPSLSPDATRLAFAAGASGNRDLWVISVSGGQRLQVTSDPADDESPVWSPDGRELLFCSDRGGAWGIWKVGQLGGRATLVVPEGQQPAISPDGTRLAFARPGDGGYLRIAVVPLADPDDVRYLTGAGDGLWNHTSPAWSPDGRLICYADQNELWLVPAAGGAARRLTSGGRNDRRPAWAHSGREIYFSSERGGTLAIWAVGVEGGAPRRLTMGTGPESEVAVARDGSCLAYSTQRVAPSPRLRDLVTGREVELPELRDVEMASLAPGGDAVVYVADRWGVTGALWRQDLRDGRPAGEPVRLVEPPGAAAQPRYAPDGRRLAYYVIQGDQRDIWVLTVAQGLAWLVTRDPGQDIYPCWSPDGERLAFVSDRAGSNDLWVVELGEDEPRAPPRRLTDGRPTVHAPAWSPDGAWIAFVGHDGRGNEVWLLPADGAGAPRRLTEGADAQRVCWQAATGEIWALGRWGGADYTLRIVSPATGQSRRPDGPELTWPRQGLALFDLSPSGRLLLCAGVGLSGDIWIWEAKPGVF